jgi:uncharacterized SAM-dependent methyltransferase
MDGPGAGGDPGFAEAVLEGLGAERKYLLSKHLYDAEGSALFDRITELDEYYPTRTEAAILRQNAPRLAEELPAGAALVEPGAGSGEKTRILLEAWPALGGLRAGRHLRRASRGGGGGASGGLSGPAGASGGGGFRRGFALPDAVEGMPVVVFFPGSTIGNFTTEAARELLAGSGRSPARRGW